MDARQRWQALQAHLRVSRTRLDDGNFSAALEAVNAALAIDPNFLAAQSLRDRILSLVPSLSAAPVCRPPLVAASSVVSEIAATPVAEENVAATPGEAVEDPIADAPIVSHPAESGVFDDLPLVVQPARAIEDARQDVPESGESYHVNRPHPGRWLVAAAVFGGVVLGASWLPATGLWSRPTVSVSPLVAPPERFAVTVTASEPSPEGGVAAGTGGELGNFSTASAVTGRITPAPIEAGSADRRLDVIPAEAWASGPTVSLAQTTAISGQSPGSSDAVNSMGSSISEGAIVPVGGGSSMPAPPAASTSPAVARAPDDEVEIKQVLQRYRRAYEGLDARSAHVVWPAVNEAALARAFEGLASQRLTFDRCDVRLEGDAADAICRGSEQYVPKVGSQNPRVERRIWRFTLRKDGLGWKIESARAER